MDERRLWLNVQLDFESCFYWDLVCQGKSCCWSHSIILILPSFSFVIKSFEKHTHACWTSLFSVFCIWKSLIQESQRLYRILQIAISRKLRLKTYGNIHIVFWISQSVWLWLNRSGVYCLACLCLFQYQNWVELPQLLHVTRIAVQVKRPWNFWYWTRHKLLHVTRIAVHVTRIATTSCNKNSSSGKTTVKGKIGCSANPSGSFTLKGLLLA